MFVRFTGEEVDGGKEMRNVYRVGRLIMEYFSETVGGVGFDAEDDVKFVGFIHFHKILLIDSFRYVKDNSRSHRV